VSFLLDLVELRPSKHSRLRFDGVGGTANNADAKNLFGCIFSHRMGMDFWVEDGFYFLTESDRESVSCHQTYATSQVPNRGLLASLEFLC